MKVICINDMYSTLTLNKVYNVLYTFDMYYYMKNDINENFYPKFLFITVEDYRNKKIEEIL